MALYMIGLGLNDEKDISIRGLEIVKGCDYLFVESYTSHLINADIDGLANYYGKRIVAVDRDFVEKGAQKILLKAKNYKVGFLVAGDVFSGTTHIDLFLRAKKRGIRVEIIHNTSIFTAVGVVGLELYKYGKTTSMPYFEKSFHPKTPGKVIKANWSMGLHTLVLLDIKADKSKYMTIHQALQQFLKLGEQSPDEIPINPATKCVACARLGSGSQIIRFGRIQELLAIDFGDPLHCLIFPGKLHFKEEEMLHLWEINS